MIRKLSFLAFIFLTPLLVNAQLITCGKEDIQLSNSEQRVIQDFIESNKDFSFRSNAVDTVLLTIHLVVPPGGNEPGLKYEEIATAIDGANRIFGSAGIYFSICGSPRLINGAFTYTFNTAAQLNRQNYVPSTINMYFIDEIFTGDIDSSPAGFAYLPYNTPAEERSIFIDKDVTSNGATIIHELGHYYGLFHTHQSSFGLEFVNGSNCENSGDLLCDTPADPNVLRFMAGCNYIGNFVDPNGDAYLPPVTNFMSYAPSACRREFSEQQKALVRAVHENQNSNVIGSCGFYPDFAVDSDLEDRTITSIQDLFVTYNFTNIGLEEDYEVNFKVTLFDDEERTIGVLLHEQKIQLSALDRNTELFLFLDIPERKTGGEYFLVGEIDADGEVIERTEQNNLSTTKITIDNSQFQDLSLFPNPAQEDLFVFFRDTQITGAFTVRIFRYDGVEVLADQGNKIGEEFLRKLDVRNLNRGLYLALIDFEQRNFTRTFKFYKN